MLNNVIPGLFFVIAGSDPQSHGLMRCRVKPGMTLFKTRVTGVHARLGGWTFLPAIRLVQVDGTEWCVAGVSVPDEDSGALSVTGRCHRKPSGAILSSKRIL